MVDLADELDEDQSSPIGADGAGMSRQQVHQPNSSNKSSFIQNKNMGGESTRGH